MVTALTLHQFEDKLMTGSKAGDWQNVFITLVQMRRRFPASANRIARTITTTAKSSGGDRGCCTPSAAMSDPSDGTGPAESAPAGPDHLPNADVYSFGPLNATPDRMAAIQEALRKAEEP